MEVIHVDVVVPTIRLAPEYLVPILQLRPSEGMNVTFIIVVDAPDMKIGAAVQDHLDRVGSVVVRNGHNIGASGARNKGIDAGTGDYILFLDDDIYPDPTLLDAYALAIRHDDGQSPGFVGVTLFPEPNNRFTAGVIASDILTFFHLPSSRASMPWGVTANLLVRRSALENLRFSSEFPKEGGGEDIDLCLRMTAQGGGRSFVTVPDAVVSHGWWREGKRSYGRFYRWAFGDGRLPVLHPEHRYYNFPTGPEFFLFASCCLAGFMASGRVHWTTAAIYVLGAALVEFVVDFAKLRLRGQSVPPGVAMESTLVRLSNDLGRLCGNISRWHPQALLERFDYFCTTESIRYERWVAGSKTVGWGLLALVFLL